MSLLPKLQSGLTELGLDLSTQQQQQLIDYLAMIIKWNKVYNLTAIRDVDEMLTHHILDSLAVVRPLQKHLLTAKIETHRVLDVGAGAGLPGVVIAICCSNIQVVCVDTVGKKTAFIQQAAATLGLKNLKGLHSRVEEMKSTDVGTGFDVITSRAFASLLDFTKLTAAHLSGAGVWMAMKAKPTMEELVALPMGVCVFHVERLVIPDLNEERKIIWMRRKVQNGKDVTFGTEEKTAAVLEFGILLSPDMD